MSPGKQPTDPARHRLLFQPVVDLRRGTVVGYEALSRFRGPPVAGPDAWFAAAGRLGLGAQLDARVLQRVLDLCPRLPPNCFLTVNLDPNHLVTEPVQRCLTASPTLAGVVVELTEHSPVGDYPTLLAAVAELRLRPGPGQGRPDRDAGPLHRPARRLGAGRGGRAHRRAGVAHPAPGPPGPGLPARAARRPVGHPARRDGHHPRPADRPDLRGERGRPHRRHPVGRGRRRRRRGRHPVRGRPRPGRGGGRGRPGPAGRAGRPGLRRRAGEPKRALLKVKPFSPPEAVMARARAMPWSALAWAATASSSSASPAARNEAVQAGTTSPHENSFRHL